MTRKLILLFVVWILLAGAPLEAAVVGTADDALTIGGGARPLGMGRAFVAIADDADAPFINPAGIAGIKGPQAMSMFTNLLGEIYYAEFSGAIPSPYGTIGAGYIITGVTQIPTLVGTSVVNTDYYDALLLITYSTPLGRFFEYGRNIFVGANYKLFNRGWTGGINQSATGISADFGIKYIYSPYVSFGFNRQNLIPVSLGGVLRWGGGTEEAFAGINKLGVAIKPPQFDNRLLLAADVDLPAQSDRPTIMHLGAEWKASEYLQIRGGADQTVDASSPGNTRWIPAAGVSLGYGGFRVDYAYHPAADDASVASTYVSLSYTGEPWFALKGTTR